jgi:hypothetical protein
MKWLLHDGKLTFIFRSSYVSCLDYSYGNYQTNGILSFAALDLAFEITKQQKRKFIVLKKRKPIIHLLNYIDILNSEFNSNIFNITFFSKDNYETRLAYNLYLYRNRYFKNLNYKDRLDVIERENLCVIRFVDDYANRVQPKNVNLAAMVMHIFKKEESDEINVNGIIHYCVLLM